jgi:hypothetical protein
LALVNRAAPVEQTGFLAVMALDTNGFLKMSQGNTF